MRLWDLSPSAWRYNGTPMEILHLWHDNINNVFSIDMMSTYSLNTCTFVFISCKMTIRVGDPLTRSTHLREVANCDVIKRQMTSWLTLSGDVQQKLTFEENSSIFARIFTKQRIKIYFSASRMLTTWRGIARTRSCHAWKRGHLIIYSYL